jgi:transcriptional regulator with XRE-family HTH domain
MHVARWRAGLSPEELARQVGLTPSEVVQLERGLHPAATPQLYRQVAHALGVDLRWLLAGDTRQSQERSSR